MPGTKDAPQGLSHDSRGIANIIIQTGRDVGASWRDIQIALMTAFQESGMRNLDYGDRDSLGVFQQRTSMDWGSREQILDPHYAARAFFLGAGTNKGLLDIKGRDKMSLAQAAQAVQRSAYPDRYAAWADRAAQLVDDARGGGMKIAPAPGRTDQMSPLDFLTKPGLDSTVGVTPTSDAMAALQAQQPGGAAGAPGLQESTAGAGLQPDLPNFTPDEYANQMVGRYGQKGVDQTRRGLIDYARQFVGTPYVWGGTDLKSGVDCSGFVQSVFAKFGIEMPRISYQQVNSGKRVGLDRLRPGDLVGWDNSPRNPGADHVAIYLGKGRIIEAPRPGVGVRIRKLGNDEGAWGSRLDI